MCTLFYGQTHEQSDDVISFFNASASIPNTCKTLKASPHLQRIDVSNCALGSACSQLVDAVIDLPILHEISVVNNGITDDSAGDIFRLIDRCRSLRTLVLSHNRLTATGMHCISEVLKNPRCPLRSLALTSNDIGDLGVMSIAAALKVAGCSSSLRQLTLNIVSCGNDGAKALAVLMAENDVLEGLALNGNSINDEGTRALLHGIATNLNILAMGLYGNDTGFESRDSQQIDVILERNRSLRERVRQTSCRLLSLARVLLHGKKRVYRPTSSACPGLASEHRGETTPVLDSNSLPKQTPTPLHYVDLPTELKETILRCQVFDLSSTFHTSDFASLSPLTDRQFRSLLNYASDPATLYLSRFGPKRFLETVDCDRWREGVRDIRC